MVLTLGDFPLPVNAIAFQGELIVAESYTKSIYRVKAGAAPEILISNLGAPAGLLATQNDLWISDQVSGTILKIIEDGITLEEPLIIATDLDAPEGLAFAADGKLLVVEAGAARLSAIGLSTGHKEIIANDLQLGLEGLGPFVPSTYIFNDVTVNAAGSIYVSGDVANVIYRFDPI